MRLPEAGDDVCEWGASTPNSGLARLLRAARPAEAAASAPQPGLGRLVPPVPGTAGVTFVQPLTLPALAGRFHATQDAARRWLRAYREG